MVDRPIIFSAPMVRALLEGRKTQTRRLAWRLPRISPDFPGKPSPWQKVKPGDRLWVRESACKLDRDHAYPDPFAYKADTPAGSEGDDIRKAYGYKWTPSIHMPRMASRLTLAVTATKSEQLQDISEADAEAEGVTKVRDHCYVVRGFDYDTAGLCHSRPSIAFAKLWQHLHGQESWDANPEVAALTFTVHKHNIDALPKAAAA